MLFKYLASNYIAAQIGRIEMLVVFQHDGIRHAQLPIRSKYDHDIDLPLVQRLIFEPDIHIHGRFKLQPVGLAQGIIAVFPLEEIIFGPKYQLAGYVF